MNRCADCGQNLHWRDNLPVLWEGQMPHVFCSLHCRDRFTFRANRPLRAA